MNAKGFSVRLQNVGCWFRRVLTAPPYQGRIEHLLLSYLSYLRHIVGDEFSVHMSQEELYSIGRLLPRRGYVSVTRRLGTQAVLFMLPVAFKFMPMLI